MAGTLTYRVRIDHIYQRRFDLPDFATALANSHWYLLTRRPAARIVPGSIEIDDSIVTLDIVTSDDIDTPPRTHTIGGDFRQFGTPRDFELVDDGAYFSMAVDDGVLHGDAWALASLLTGTAPEIACHEVLYVGQAFGNDGSSNTWLRTSRHKKLQRIYEDHVGSGYDIFVIALSLEKRMWTGDDHIDDDDDGPDLSAYYEHFADLESGRIRKLSVDLVEHGLISYFTPHYNDNLTEWRPGKPTEDMRRMRSAGFRLLNIHLSGWWGLARLFSPQVQEPRRSHFISHDVPPSPRPGVVRGLSADAISDWRIEAMVVREAADHVMTEAEKTGAIMRVFGDEAPKIRRPPGATSRRQEVGKSAVYDADAHSTLRSRIRAKRESDDRENRPLLHPGTSSYVPEAGAIVIGQYEDGTEGYWRLHDPQTGHVESGLILGEAGSGRSNMLTVIAVEAVMTGCFVVMPLDPSNRNDYPSLWSKSKWITTDVPGTIRLLTAVCAIIAGRQEEKVFTRPSTDVPAVLVTIDDPEPVLSELGGAQLIDEILKGGSVGVGLILTLNGIDSLRSHRGLLRSLASCQKLALTTQSFAVMSELNATYGDERTTTVSEGLSFVLHCGPATTTIGLIGGFLNPTMTSREAQAWCNARFRERGWMSVSWEQVDDEPKSWYAMSADVTPFWFLRHHEDVWCLVKVFSRTGVVESIADALRWADGCIDFRYECTRTPWQRGPAPWQDGTRAFYSDIRDELTPKDTSEAVFRAILDMH